MQNDRLQAESGAGDSDELVTVCRACDPFSADHLRVLFTLFEIKTAVIQRDMLGFGLAVLEVVVFSADQERARQSLEAMQQRHTEDWQCPQCAESVPMTFDVCWNCETLHPELETQGDRPHEAEPADAGGIILASGTNSPVPITTEGSGDPADC